MVVERCDRYTRLSKNVRASKPRIHERARPAKIDIKAVTPSGKKKKTHSSMRSTPASRGEKYHGHSPHREPAYRSSNAVASKRPTVANIRSRHVQRFRSETAFGWVAGAWYGFGVLFTLQVCLAIQENLSASGHNPVAAIDAPFEAALSAVPCS